MIDIDDKMLKVVALAKQGVGGERDAAIATLKRLCKRHGLNFDDVMNKSDVREYVLDLPYRNKDESDILAQVCFKFALFDGGSLHYNEVRKVFIYETTAAKHIECSNAAAVYIAAYRHERKRMLKDLTAAFIYKHSLTRPAENSEARKPYEPPTGEKLAALRRQANLVENLDNVTIHEAIEGSNEQRD